MNNINILELFSGIGGFTKGFIDAGHNINKHYFSEIDKHAIANYKYNFPHAEYIGSVTDVDGRNITRPNIITFGSPCQDFSLAGKRKGMEGQRSSLILHAIRLIGECRPDIFIWENVKGAYSSNSGADFWGIIQAFANIGGYRLEWQLLNTSWFLPQNRERIYLIGHLAEGSGRNVFPITEADSLCDRRREDEKEVHANNRNAITQQARQYANWGGDFICVAQRGRNPENPSNRTTGAHTEQRLEPNSQGTTNTLTSVAKDNLIMVKSNTEKGFEEAKEGLSPTIDQSAGRWQSNTTNIRRLTEIECERLQGFPDNWTEYGDYDGVVKRIPKTQRYKMLGNAVTVDVVKAIAQRLKQ